MRNLSWLIRVVALVVVGVSTLTIPASNTRNLVIDIIAFVVATLGVALWTATDCSPAYRARFAGLLPYAAAATTLTCSWAALSNNGGPFILLSSMALVWAGNALSFRAAGAITALGVIAIVSVPLVFTVSTWDWLGLPVVLLLSLVFGRLLRSYRVQAEQSDVLLAKSEQLRQEQGRAATLDERNRIAREIHDVLAHSLGALSVQIQAARAVLTDQRDVDRAVELLGQAQRMTTEGLVETRRALQALRTDTPPLPDGLAELSAVHQLRYRAPVSFEVTGAPTPAVTRCGVGADPDGARGSCQHGQVRPSPASGGPARIRREVHRSECGQQAVPADGQRQPRLGDSQRRLRLGRYARTAFAHARLAQRRPPG